MIKNCKKIVAFAITVSFVFCQAAFAANPRELLSRAKSSFDVPDTRRGGFVSTQELQNSQAEKEALVNRLQVLEDQVLEDFSNNKDQGLIQLVDRIEEVPPAESPNQMVQIVKPIAPAPSDLPTLVGTEITDFYDGARISGLFSPTNDTYFSSLNWLQQVNGDEAWDFTRGAGTTLAVLDTGIDLDHPDLAGNIWTNAAELNGLPLVDDDGNGFVDDIRGWDFSGNDNSPNDLNGHGTHVAGIIGAVRNNGIGTTGIAPETKIIPVQVLDSNGGGYWPDLLYDIIDGIKYAANLGADVISMSLGMPYYLFTSTQLTDFRNAVGYARGLGSVVVVAAGNENLNVSTLYPAGFDNVITVGSVNSLNNRSSFSNFGTGLDIMAPGESVLSTLYNNTYGYGTGTSMATPIVSGTVALLLSQDPFQSFDDLYRRLRFSSADLGASGFDVYYGNGLVNAFKALSYDYYDSGIVKTYHTANGDLYEYFDEDFFGNSTGRLIKKTKPDGSYNEYRYWYDSAQVRFDSSYDSSGNLAGLIAYDEGGNIIVGSDPVLNQTLNAQSYTSASGAVYKSGTDTLIMYGNRSVNYALNIGEGGNYSLKFSTAQISSKNAPPGYLFNFNIKIDGVTLANVNLNSSRTFTPSDFIDLGNLTAGNLTQGIHTLTLQWTNDYNASIYDANVGIKGIEVYALVGDVSVPPLPPCDGVSCIYDPSGRLDTVYFSNGTHTQYEYIAGTTQPSQISEINQLGDPIRNIFPSQNLVDSFYYYPSNRVQKIVITTYNTSAFLRQYDYYDEPGFSLNRGRLSRFTNQDGAYTTYEQYFGTSAIAKFQKDYNTNGNLLVTREYDSVGNLISTTYPPLPADPILVSTINAQSYTSASGTVYKFGTDTLAMYGNRSVNYALTIGEASKYSLKFQTAQISSKNAPPGYLFNFNIKVDGVTVVTVGLNSSRTYTPSDFINLGNLTAGNLTQGVHTLTLQWTNDYNVSPYDANVGFKNIELYRMPSDQIAPTGSVSINNGVTHTNSAAVTLNLDAADAVSSQNNLQMAFSQDGVNLTPFESFATEKILTLTGEDGEKTISVRFRDEAGNTAEFSDTIVLDRIAPSATLTSPTITNLPLYTLAYTVMDNVDGERTLSEQITLLQGSNSISRTVTDIAGNSRTLAWTVTLLPVSSTLPAAYQAAFVPLEWVETTALTGITGDDQGISFALPFIFRFFGEVFTQIQISSNGFVQFGSCIGCSDYTPDTIPNLSSPNGIAAPLWRDLNPGRGGRITYLASPTQFVVSWEDVPTFSSPYNLQRFQLILQSDGSLTYQYVTVTSGPTTAVGLENSAGTQGMAYTLLPRNGIAVKFSDINQ